MLPPEPNSKYVLFGFIKERNAINSSFLIQGLNLILFDNGHSIKGFCISFIVLFIGNKQENYKKGDSPVYRYFNLFSKEIAILLLIVNKFEAALFIFSLFSFFEISFKINFNFFSKNNVKKILNNNYSSISNFNIKLFSFEKYFLSF